MFLQYFARTPFFQGPKPGTHASRFIVWVIGFFAFLDVYSIQAVLPMVKKEFNTTPMQAGIVVGVTLFAVAIISPFIGLISDRIGRKNVVVSALIALSIPTTLIPLCSDLHLLMVLRFFQGLAVPGIVVVTMAYIAEEFPATSIARVTTAYVSGTVMGGFCGRFITGHVTEWSGNWRIGFMVLAALNILGVFLVYKLLPSSQHFTPSANMRQGLRTLVKHIKNPKLLAASAVGFCVLFSLVSSFTYVNFLLDHAPYNLSSGDLANVFCVYLLGVFITPLAGRVIARVGNQRVLLCALAAALFGILLTLFSPLFIIIIGLAISSSGIFVCQSASIGFVAQNVNEGRSLAAGLYNLSYYCGGFIGTWVAGIAYNAYQWPGSVAVIATVQIIAAAIAWFCWRSPVKAGL